MTYEWDESKRTGNMVAHGVDFADIERFDWDTAQVADDERRDYGEPRQIALGLIGNRLHVCIFTMRLDTTRIISLRKANRREVISYET